MPEKKVYFAGAIRGDRSAGEAMGEMVQFIKSLGFRVLSEHVGAKNPTEVMDATLGRIDADLTAEEIEKRDIAWLDEAPYVIAEVTGASTGTGREIEYARTKENFGKIPAKILCLYRRDREFFASPMIRGMLPDRYSNVSVSAYDTFEDAKKLIEAFLNK